MKKQSKRGLAISLAKKGKKLPKMSKALLGYIVTKKTRDKISNSTRGNKHWNWGKHLSQKTRIKISLAHKGMKHSFKTIVKLRALKGSLNSRWKGGITKEDDRLRRQWKSRDWSKKVKLRDNFICQKCMKQFGNNQLVSHHLKSWKDYPKLRFEISNGITLCKLCHLKLHSKNEYSRQNYKG